MKKAAIFGAAGAIGRTLAEELERRGVPFRAVGRRGSALREAFGNLRLGELCEADLSVVNAAADAARGCDVVFYTVGVPYTDFRLHPALMRSALEGAVAVQAPRIVVVSSVYSYGAPQSARVAETHPRLPDTYKGRMRKEQEDLALEAQRKGQIDAMVVRLPDFYGPHADNSLANPIFRAALKGGAANWLGPAETLHEFIFTPDAARAIVDLASCAECYGEAWNVGGPGAIPGAEFIGLVYRALGKQPKFRTAGRGMLTAMGWFNPLFRELKEMLYLAETPVILDDSKLLARFPELRKTSYDEGIRLTIEWMRANPQRR